MIGSTRTAAQIAKWVDETMYRMDLPVQFLGDEPNAYGKPWDSARTRMLLCASWPYEAAAGNQSIPAVYKQINDAGPEFLADRFYLPATPHDLRLIEKAGIPIFGIESKRGLADFDVVGTSIAYPLLIISFYKMLAMSGVPVRWKERERIGLENYPMVLVGGQAFGAPECLAPAVDAFWLGEVEEEPGNPGIQTVFRRIDEMKTRGLWATDRLGCYERLAREFNFLYFPRFVDVHYGYEDRAHVLPIDNPLPSKVVTGYESNLSGMRMPFVKRYVKDLDAVVPLDNPPLLFNDPGMGSGDLEVGRGCPAWCSFCALTYRQKPYRQRSVPYMRDYALRYTRNMGGTTAVPFMPDMPMHTQRKALIGDLLQYVSDEVDAPAMRVDDFISDPDCILLQVHGGMDGVTLGVEGNSQRMRDLVGKGCSDEDIKEAVARGIRAGIKKFKMFMISNLPGEDEGDIFRILRLAKDLADIRDSMDMPTVRIQFSWTPLLIEANTPFQWFAAPVASRALGDVWEAFREIKVEFKLGGKSEPNKSAFFQLCQRASRDVGEAIVDVCDLINAPGKGGCWGGVPKITRDQLDDALRAHGFANGFEDCFDERFKADMFGWEFIDQGVSPELLWVTYLQMREFVEQTDSHTYDLNFGDDYHGNEWIERCDTKCYGKTCGTCDVEDLKIRKGYIAAGAHEASIDLSHIPVIDQRSQVVRVRARLIRDEKYRHVMNDHWRFHVRRAAFKTLAEHPEWGFNLAKRTIKFASDGVLYKDWTCGVDYMEFALTRTATQAQVQVLLDGMNTHCRGLTIGAWTLGPASNDSMKVDIDLSLWELEIDVDPTTVLARLEAWHATDYVKMILKSAGEYFSAEREEFNAKDYCDDLWLIRDGPALKLRCLLRGRPSPYNLYAALMGRASWIDAAKKAGRRLEAFTEVDREQYDFFRVVCSGCDRLVPTNLMDEPYDPQLCPHCRDRETGIEVSEVSFA